MKKFYTILAATLAGTMMVSAANRISEAKANTAFDKDFKVVENFSAAQMPVIESKNVAKAPAAKAPATAEEVTGEYLFKAYARDFDSQGSAYWMNESAPYVEVAADNSVTIEGFWDTTFNLTGTFDPTAGTITIPYTQKVTVPISATETKDLNVYVIGFETMQPSDLVLKVDVANRLLSWDAEVGSDGYYATTLLIGTYGEAYGSKIFDQMYHCTLNEINSIMSWAALDEKGDPILDESGNAQKYTTYVYTEVANDKLTVYNFCDFSPYKGSEGCFDKAVEMTLDKTAKTATATNQSMPFPNGATNLDFYVCGINAAGDAFNYEAPELVFEGEETPLQNGAVVTSFYTPAIGILGVQGTSTYGNDFYEVEYLVLEPLFTGEAGIDNVIADEDANAPVEYFNLQGVRVENPAAGIYVRRQGNNVSKVLVK